MSCVAPTGGMQHRAAQAEHKGNHQGGEGQPRVPGPPDMHQLNNLCSRARVPRPGGPVQHPREAVCDGHLRAFRDGVQSANSQSVPCRPLIFKHGLS